MRLVFDLDDTICRAHNRDYANAKPIMAVVDKIRACREALPDVEIVIHTSRGMASCNGDVALAEAKNRPIIEQWLAEHGLQVDKIIFGKPLGDIYIDDKAMSAYEFGFSDIGTFSGFSGSRVIRIGNTIIKEANNAVEQFAWYEQAQTHYRQMRETCPSWAYNVTIPVAYGVTLGKLYLEFVPGILAAKMRGNEEDIVNRLQEMLRYEPIIDGENDLNAYADYIDSRARAIGLETSICERLRGCELLRPRTFCHGDLSLLNVICHGDELVLIDPSVKPFMETWLVDAGKLRASIVILDEALAGVRHHKSLATRFDYHYRIGECVGLYPSGTLDAVKLMCQSHIIRVWYYANKLGKDAEKAILSDFYHKTYGE